jgi:UDP:flavonoid glycosyltransferase YjiC (YdhE family)
MGAAGGGLLAACSDGGGDASPRTSRRMRVLFMPSPAIGHAFPMVPLAWTLRALGHDVMFVTGGDGLAVTRAGVPVLDALPGVTGPAMLAGFAKAAPQLFTPLGERPIEEMNRRKPHILALWDPYVDAHLALAERARPDLVLYDPVFGVGPLVAAKLNIPTAALGLGILRFPPELLRDPVASAAFRRHNLKLPEGVKTIDMVPPSLAEGPPSPLAMRYLTYNGGGVLPDWLLAPASKPRIAVTLGPLANAEILGMVERIATAAGGNAEVVVVLSEEPDPNAPGAPRALPPNVRTTSWVPLNELLRTCAAVIHHGADSTTLTCCAMGVPQLVLPQAPDNIAIAEMLRTRGAAHIRQVGDLAAAAITELLNDDKLRRVAGELRDEMSAMPSPAELVPRLAELR